MPAKKGNTNALKHGIYGRHYTPDETDRLDRIDEDLAHEINILRVFVDRLAEQLKDKSDYTEGDRAKLNLIVTMTTAIGTLTTRKAFMTGKVSQVQEAIEEAVHSRAPMWTKA